MLYVNLKSAWRNLIRNPFSSVINIVGLATGITCCIVISLYIWSETQADKFHQSKDHLFRVNPTYDGSGRAGGSSVYPLGTSLQNEYPEIKKLARLGQDNVSIRANKDAYFYEQKFYWADSTFFGMFSFDVIQGDASAALKDPYSLVLTQSMARKYFPDGDPIGKTVDVKVYDGDKKFSLVVTAVVKDVPKTSTIQFEFLAPMSLAMKVYPQFENHWNLSWVTTFVLSDDNDALVSRSKTASAFFTKYAGKDFARSGLEFQPLSRWHLYSGHVGNNLVDGILNVYLFALIGILIFLLACVNFVNLSTARAELRKKEIGVRKALGAFRKQLFTQFMMEAILTAAIVLIISFGATSALSPVIRLYIDDTAIVFPAVVLPAAFLFFMVLIALCAGVYPAAFLSAVKPLDALKARVVKSTGGSFNARQSLVVFQFTISIALIAGTLIIRKQVDYLKTADLGMTTDQLITIPVDDRELQKKILMIKQLMGQTSGVKEASVSGETFPAAMNNTWNIEWPGISDDTEHSIDVISIDHDYFNVINAQFVKGHNISAGNEDRFVEGFIINESAQKMINQPEVIGLEITINERKGPIIGVVKDIHHYSLHQKVSPIAYFPVPAGDRACSDNLVLKINAASAPAAIASLKQKWETLTNDRPFEYHFVNEEFGRAYEQEVKFLALFEVFSGLAIVVACLGLMGLSSFVVNKRTKEIGIRKVLGASIAQILMLLTKGFTAPIAVAFVISGPVVYFVMMKWLDTFAYRVSVDLLLIGVAGVGAWCIALLFIGIQSWKAARINPVESLRDE